MTEEEWALEALEDVENELEQWGYRSLDDWIYGTLADSMDQEWQGNHDDADALMYQVELVRLGLKLRNTKQ